MKKIIRGRTYNTEKAQRIGSWNNGHGGGDLDYMVETLYRKRTGEYFLEGCGGARSRYAEIDGNMMASGCRIVPLSFDQARNWAEEHLTPYAESLGIHGIGWYEKKSFTHIDNRDRVVRWKDSGSNVVKTFGSPAPVSSSASGAKYTNSPLVKYTRLTEKHSGQRTHAIDRITPHCMDGQLTAQQLANVYSGTRPVSSNYGIAVDGTVGLYVEEKNRSWCSSSAANDQRAITIECASDDEKPYTFKPIVYETLVKLCIDICKRNGKKKTSGRRYSPEAQ